MWRFPDGSLYSLGSFTWHANFVANTFVQDRGVTNIGAMSGAFYDKGSFTDTDHSDPEWLAPPTIQQAIMVR